MSSPRGPRVRLPRGTRLGRRGTRRARTRPAAPRGPAARHRALRGGHPGRGLGRPRRAAAHGRGAGPAVRAVERVAGRAAEAVVPLNAAAENALIALATAARCGLPLVDGDGCGPVHPPLLEQTLYARRVAPAPLALATPSGDVVAVESARGPVENLAAPALASGGWAAAAAYPMTVPGLPRASSRNRQQGRRRRRGHRPGALRARRPRSLVPRRHRGGRTVGGAYDTTSTAPPAPVTGLPGGPAGRYGPQRLPRRSAASRIARPCRPAA
ncbi:DUF917 family protein [Streptomyces sp. KL110A]|uniref:S-methyl thiohydantoin desulfurase domain-containing protein n=1 Tax=Streptomyces sp. KL110A TaxID=3384221 RepID=UPI0038CABE61